MKKQLARALFTKDKALGARDSGRLEEALSLISEATDQLDELWEQRCESIDRAGANASPEERDLVEALAETYGVKGGILRSAGDPENAALAYDKGLRFEEHAARKVDNSYNLVQNLVNRVLVAPQLVGETKWEVLSKDMWKELEKTSDELRRQITGSRANDPWAAADMIMIQLLLAPRNASRERKPIDDALGKLRRLNPKARVYASTLRAIRDLATGLEKVTDDQRLEGWHIVDNLLNEVIKELEVGFEEAKARS